MPCSLFETLSQSSKLLQGLNSEWPCLRNPGKEHLKFFKMP